MNIIKKVFQWLVVLLMVAVFVRGVVFIAAPAGSKSAATQDHIAVIDIDGIIYSSDKLIETLKKLEENDKTKAYLIRINSPGGLVTPSQEMYEYMLKLKKPTYAVMGSTAASGGYMVALPAKKIYAMPSTVTGSIGVIMQIPNYSGLYEKIGLSLRVIKSGQFKDIGSPTRVMTEEEEAVLSAIVMDMYDQFVEAVSKSRGLNPYDTRRLADGRIYTGRMALENGLIDGLASWQEVIEMMKTDLNMPDLIYIEQTEDQTYLQKLLSGLAKDIKPATGALPLSAGFYFMLEL